MVKDDKVQPTPVYKLTWTPPHPGQKPDLAEANVVLRWRSLCGKGDLLELARVTPAAGAPDVTLDQLHLELNTLMEEDGEFWLDKPTLEVDLG